MDLMDLPIYVHNSTLQNATLHNGMLQNSKLQNGTALQNGTVTKQYGT